MWISTGYFKYEFPRAIFWVQFRKVKWDKIMFFWKKKNDTEDFVETLSDDNQLPEPNEQAAERRREKLSSFASKGESEERGKGEMADASSDEVKLFPGFADKGFDVGYAIWQGETEGAGPEKGAPTLVMRWRGETNWFPVPPEFNKAFMQVINDIERDNGLSALLASYGYDVEGA